MHQLINKDFADMQVWAESINIDLSCHFVQLKSLHKDISSTILMMLSIKTIRRVVVQWFITLWQFWRFMAWETEIMTSMKIHESQSECDSVCLKEKHRKNIAMFLLKRIDFNSYQKDKRDFDNKKSKMEAMEKRLVRKENIFFQ